MLDMSNLEHCLVRKHRQRPPGEGEQTEAPPSQRDFIKINGKVRQNAKEGPD